jgi:hypothetical protein
MGTLPTILYKEAGDGQGTGNHADYKTLQK